MQPKERRETGEQDLFRSPRAGDYLGHGAVPELLRADETFELVPKLRGRPD